MVNQSAYSRLHAKYACSKEGSGDMPSSTKIESGAFGQCLVPR